MTVVWTVVAMLGLAATVWATLWFFRRRALEADTRRVIAEQKVLLKKELSKAEKLTDEQALALLDKIFGEVQ